MWRYLAPIIIVLVLAGVLWKYDSGKNKPAGDNPPAGNQTANLPADLSASQDTPKPPLTPPDDPAKRETDRQTAPPVAPDENPTRDASASGSDIGLAPPAGTGQPDLARQRFTEGKAAFDSQQYLQASRQLSEAVRLGLSGPAEQEARQMANQAADHWLFSRNIYEDDPLCSRHLVASGELLLHIEKHYSVPYQLLMKINGMKDDRGLRAGKTIKVVQGPFHVVVQRKRFLMSIFLGDVLVRSYRVGLGQPGRQTPTGLWLVELKQPNPEWVDPETHHKYLPNDPENPLGDRWIRLKGLKGDALGREGFGIHGTVKPEEIGQAASRGCIRLHNGNVRELYDLLMPQKSRVLVVD